MRCSYLECVNNEFGFCACLDDIEINSRGECDSKFIAVDFYREREDNNDPT